MITMVYPNGVALLKDGERNPRFAFVTRTRGVFHDSEDRADRKCAEEFARRHNVFGISVTEPDVLVLNPLNEPVYEKYNPYMREWLFISRETDWHGRQEWCCGRYIRHIEDPLKEGWSPISREHLEWWRALIDKRYVKKSYEY